MRIAARQSIVPGRAVSERHALRDGHALRTLRRHRQVLGTLLLVFVAAAAGVLVPDPANGKDDAAVQDAVRQALDAQYSAQALWHTAPPSSGTETVNLRSAISNDLEAHFTGAALVERLNALTVPRRADPTGVAQIHAYDLTAARVEPDVQDSSATASGTYVVVLATAGAYAADVSTDQETRAFTAELRKLDGAWLVSKLDDRLVASVPVTGFPSPAGRAV